MLRGVAHGGAGEERHQGVALLVYLGYHQAQLLFVLRHVVGLARDELLAALLQLRHLLYGKLGHLRQTACRLCLGGEVALRVGPLGSRGGPEGRRQLLCHGGVVDG